jgi:TRAP-type mannitol/chloroaromatic compound transport system substrate-binding protein
VSTASHDGTTPVRINWRVPAFISSSLPVLGTSIVEMSETARTVTDGAIRLNIYDPGEIVPAFSITDAVRDRKVEAGFTWPGYDQGKIPASTLIGATPFGMEPWEFSAWWFNGGGRALGEALYRPHNIMPLYCGMIGPETAGWFREPITSIDDLKGLKIRFAGLGGQIIERAGASVTMLPGGEIFQALEKGAIDATEFSLPIADEALGFGRIVKYNYYPGWHQPFSSLFLVINIDIWNELNPVDQALLETTCTASVTRMFSNGESTQGAVIAAFSQSGVIAETLPEDVLRQLKSITDEVLDEQAAVDKDFKAILESQREFHEMYLHWRRLAYLPVDFL